MKDPLTSEVLFPLLRTFRKEIQMMDDEPQDFVTLAQDTLQDQSSLTDECLPFIGSTSIKGRWVPTIHLPFAILADDLCSRE
jgi:hypothetical protein